MNVALKDKWGVWLENYLLRFGHYLIVIKFYTMLSIFFSISYRITTELFPPTQITFPEENMKTVTTLCFVGYFIKVAGNF